MQWLMFIKKSRLSNLSPKDLLDKLLMFQVLKESLEHTLKTRILTCILRLLKAIFTSEDANDNVGGTN